MFALLYCNSVGLGGSIEVFLYKTVHFATIWGFFSRFWVVEFFSVHSFLNSLLQNVSISYRLYSLLLIMCLFPIVVDHCVFWSLAARVFGSIAVESTAAPRLCGVSTIIFQNTCFKTFLWHIVIDSGQELFISCRQLLSSSAFIPARKRMVALFLPIWHCGWFQNTIDDPIL